MTPRPRILRAIGRPVRAAGLTSALAVLAAGLAGAPSAAAQGAVFSITPVNH